MVVIPTFLDYFKDNQFIILLDKFKFPNFQYNFTLWVQSDEVIIMTFFSNYWLFLESTFKANLQNVNFLLCSFP